MMTKHRCVSVYLCTYGQILNIQIKKFYFKSNFIKQNRKHTQIPNMRHKGNPNGLVENLF